MKKVDIKKLKLEFNKFAFKNNPNITKEHLDKGWKLFLKKKGLA